MTKTLQVRQRGTLTLPSDLRSKYSIKAGDTLHIVDLEGAFLLTPMVPMVPELAKEIELIRERTGLSTEDLLEALREERAQYGEKDHGDD